jgi:hypothetical protein
VFEETEYLREHAAAVAGDVLSVRAITYLAATLAAQYPEPPKAPIRQKYTSTKFPGPSSLELQKLESCSITRFAV